MWAATAKLAARSASAHLVGGTRTIVIINNTGLTDRASVALCYHQPGPDTRPAGAHHQACTQAWPHPKTACSSKTNWKPPSGLNYKKKKENALHVLVLPHSFFPTPTPIFLFQLYKVFYFEPPSLYSITHLLSAARVSLRVGKLKKHSHRILINCGGGGSPPA